SVKITEKALRLDFELAYRSGDFRGFAGVHIQPYSSVDVSGKLPYGDENLKVSAKHDDAIGAIVGGSLDLKADLVLFADVTLGYETRARVGLGKEW
ncbi:MAG: hypothetical protein IJP66_03125, partial [Kiritimatiellae bacterium]|nr:hypothetical protein [Kiritimatiellia bacterium]